MAVISNPEIVYTANVTSATRGNEQVQRGLAQVEQQGQTTNRAMQRLMQSSEQTAAGFQRATAAARAFVAAIGLQQFANMATAAVRSAAEIGRTADLIGITTRELQRMAFAFRDANLSQEQFNQAALTLARNVSDLQRGTGPLLDFLRQSAPQFEANFRSATTLADQFAVLANATATLASRHDQVRLAMAAGGESMQRLVPLMGQGDQVVRRLGTGFRELSADAIRTSQELERRFNEIIAGMTNALQRFVVGTANILQESSRSFDLLMQGLRQRGRFPGMDMSLLRYIDAIRQAEEASARLMNTMFFGRGDQQLADTRRFAAAAFEAEQLTARLMGQRTVLDELSTGWNNHAAEVTRALALINASHADSIEGQRAATRFTTQLQLQQQQAILQTASMAAQTITMLFPKQKGAAIAAAVINTAVGITKALSEVPWPMNWVQAALIAAQGVAQIAAIRSASPSGASAPSVAGGAGAGAADAGGAAPQMFVVEMKAGSLFSAEQVQGLMELFNEQTKNGHALIATRLT